MAERTLIMTTMRTDVVCPPNEYAQCGNCGEELRDHQSSDPDVLPALGDAVCTGKAFIRSWGSLREQFVLADGQTFDCDGLAQCLVCDADMCGDHSDDVTTCVGGGIHHDSCDHRCQACDLSRAEDSAIDRADAIRKGEW